MLELSIVQYCGDEDFLQDERPIRLDFKGAAYFIGRGVPDGVNRRDALRRRAHALDPGREFDGKRPLLPESGVKPASRKNASHSCVV